MDYKHHSDTAAREELIRRHLHLVRYIAGRLVIHLPPNVEFDDLLAYGVFGLIDAIDKFDIRRGIKFETYAYTRIKGAILDGLRSLDWAPQSLRKRGREIAKAYGKLEAELGRSATDEEVANELGMSLDELQQVLSRLNHINVLSLEDLIGGDGEDMVQLRDLIADPDSPDPFAHAEIKETRRRLIQALDTLPDREKIIISLYYYEGLTVKEIGELLGLSASRISQLHGRALLRLRGAMMQAAEPDNGAKKG